MNKSILRGIALTVFLLLLFRFSFCQNFPEKPTGFVNDYANILTGIEAEALEGYLEGVAKNTSNEIAIVTLPDLQGYSIEEFSWKIAQTWRVGGDGSDNGILICVSMAERAMRIEIGYGLEGIIPDVTANMVLSRYLIPNFKKGAYYTGLVDASQALAGLATQEFNETHLGDYRDEGHSAGDRTADWIIPMFVILVIIIAVAAAKNDGNSGGYSGISSSGWDTDSSDWSSGGWDSGGSDSGGSDFGGFSGGDFGGGGASGHW